MTTTILRILLFAFTLFGTASPAFAQSARYGMVTSVLDAAHADKTRALGAGYVRLNFYWHLIQPCSTCQAWEPIDHYMAEAAARGLKVYASLSGTPGWANGNRGINVAPTDRAAWRAFVRTAIQRYGSQYDIVFGIWNEPNLPVFLDDDSVGTRYARLFEDANTARNAVNAQARLGAPETSHHAVSSNNYYRDVMARIAPFLRPADIIAVHWYPDGPGMAGYFNTVRASAGGRELWLTETGFATCDDALQASRLRSILTSFETTAAARIFVYVLQNGMACTEAIVRPDWSNRPAYDAYRTWIAQHPFLTGPEVLNAGEALGPNQFITSSDGRFRLIYQSDGNLVLYQVNGGALWASNTSGTSAGVAVMQGDGNFVVYNAASQPVFSSGTFGRPEAYLLVQNDGNVVVYHYGTPLWWTGTGGH